MVKAKTDDTTPEPVVGSHAPSAAASLQHFANATSQKPNGCREAAANFFVGLIQLSEQEGFIIEDALRTARIRIFNAKRK